MRFIITLDELLHDKVRVRGNISEVLKSIIDELDNTDYTYQEAYQVVKDELKDLDVMRAYEDVLDRKIVKLRRL